MKINKTLAAGIAATLAVTSLASVASAVTTAWTWDMAVTTGTVGYTPAAKNVEALDPGDWFDYANETPAAGARDFALKGAVEADVDTNGDGLKTALDFDYFIPFDVSLAYINDNWGYTEIEDEAVLDALMAKIDSVTVEISGKKTASDGASTENMTQKVKLLKVDNVGFASDADAIVNIANAKSVGNYILPVYVNGGPADGAFIPERFVQVDRIDIKVNVSGEVTATGLDEYTYTEVQKGTKNETVSYQGREAWNAGLTKIGAGAGKFALLAPNADDALKIVNSWEPGALVLRFELAKYQGDASAFILDDNEDRSGWDKATSIVYAVAATGKEVVDGAPVYADADGNADGILRGKAVAKGDAATQTAALTTGKTSAVSVSGNHDGGALLSKIRETLAKGATIEFSANSFSTKDDYAWMPRTEKYPTSTGATLLFNPLTGLADRIAWTDSDEILQRDEIWCLSNTQDYNSSSYTVDVSEATSNNQTYKVTDDKGNEGTIPKYFNGMASKFADFFNSGYGEAPKKEAKVIFKFTKKANDAAASTWKNGGIPSTEVGLRNFLDAQDVKDFALFVNYNATTGSLQATATLKPESGEVEFDVSNILTALSGHTIGVVQDIYYGLANGASKLNGWDGLWVEEVRYEYNDDATSETDAKQDDQQKPADEKPADEKPADEKDDQGVVPVPGDDQTEVPADGGNNGGSAVVDTGAQKEDKNPHTGVALAVIPAIVAGAAVVASKKRK